MLLMYLYDTRSKASADIKLKNEPFTEKVLNYIQEKKNKLKWTE